MMTIDNIAFCLLEFQNGQNNKQKVMKLIIVLSKHGNFYCQPVTSLLSMNKKVIEHQKNHFDANILALIFIAKIFCLQLKTSFTKEITHREQIFLRKMKMHYSENINNLDLENAMKIVTLS